MTGVTVTLGGGGGGADAFFPHEANPTKSSPAMQASERFISRFVFGKARIVNDPKRRLGSEWRFPSRSGVWETPKQTFPD